MQPLDHCGKQNQHVFLLRNTASLTSRDGSEMDKTSTSTIKCKTTPVSSTRPAAVADTTSKIYGKSRECCQPYRRINVDVHCSKCFLVFEVFTTNTPRYPQKTETIAKELWHLCKFRPSISLSEFKLLFISKFLWLIPSKTTSQICPYLFNWQVLRTLNLKHRSQKYGTNSKNKIKFKLYNT